MTAKEVLLMAISRTGNTQESAAKLVGWSAGSMLNQRLHRNSVRADDFLNMLDQMGVDVTFTIRKTGELLCAKSTGHGRSVKGSVDRVLYDTDNSVALANSFYEDGVNEYKGGVACELYVDRKGRYFMAEYHEDGNDKIRPVTASVAAAFIEKFGTDIEKGPKPNM